MKCPKKILIGCKRGKGVAQEQLFRLFYSESMKIAMRFAKNQEDAKDVVSKAYLKVFTRIGQFEGNEDNLFGWIKRIIINQCLDLVKSKAYSQSFEQIESLEYANAHDPIEDQIGYENIIDLIQQLPYTSATVFNLYVIDGYSHDEIGSMLNITTENSRYHLSAARKKLKMWIFKMEQNESK